MEPRSEPSSPREWTPFATGVGDGAMPSPSAGCDLLVLTDSPVPGVTSVTFTSVVFVCFDAENAECLRTTGCIVREPRDYGIECLASCDDLYERYSGRVVGNDLDASSADSDVQETLHHLRHKAVEVCAPILLAWDACERILTQEHPRDVVVHFQDHWLSRVLQTYVTVRAASQGAGSV